MSFAWLARTTPLAMLPPVSRRLVTGMRHWVCARGSTRRPVAVLQDHLGCGRAAAHFQLLIEEVGQAWPDPFCLAPPCCRQTSHDESLLATIMASAAAADRPGFDRHCADLLGLDARDRLYLSLGTLARILAGTPAASTAAREH